MANLYPFLVYVLVTTFTPGPNNVMSMVNGMHFGYLRMVRFLFGICTGFFIIMLASGLSNVVLISALPAIEPLLKILGVLYMLYLAWHIVRSQPAASPDETVPTSSFRFGLTMQFLNVKVVLYGITVFSLFVVNSYRDPVSIVLFSAGLALVGFLATSCWALGGSLFRYTIHEHYRVFNWVMAGLLIYTAVESLL